MENIRNIKVELFTFSTICLIIAGLAPRIVDRGLVGACLVFVTMVGFRIFLLVRQIPTTTA